MCRYICACAVVAILFAISCVVRAADDDVEKAPSKKPSAEEAMSKFVKLGPGVHAIKKDKKGRIVSCVVVGQARISTVLGKGKGLELARDKANLAASAEFVKWLKEEVTVYQSADEESVTLIEGTEGTNEDAVKESGKAVERQSKKMESLAKSLVRGLQILHKDVDGDGKTYSVVKGWKAVTAEGVKKIAADLASDEPASKGRAKSGDSGKDRDTSKGTKPDKRIKSEKATSEDAEDFLP
jgi:hypothetical protein